MSFDEWWYDYGVKNGMLTQSGIRGQIARAAWDSAIAECREAVLATGRDAAEAAKAKDATDYIAGYQDCAVDADESLRLLISKHSPEKT